MQIPKGKKEAGLTGEMDIQFAYLHFVVAIFLLNKLFTKRCFVTVRFSFCFLLTSINSIRVTRSFKQTTGCKPKSFCKNKRDSASNKLILGFNRSIVTTVLAHALKSLDSSYVIM